MNKKTTKRALLASALALLLSVSMLVGTTFAWFTDSVSSGKNHIVAGILDIELKHSNASVTGETVRPGTELFVNTDGDPIKWEPGVVAYENFTLSNEGTLALKYSLSMNVTDYNTVTVNGTVKSLLDVLKVAVIDGTFDGDRDDATKLTYDYNLSNFAKEGHMTVQGETVEFAIVVYWEPTANDDDYNLKNGLTSSDEEALWIEFGINAGAGQYNWEKDSFDEDYDAAAGVPQVIQVTEGPQLKNAISTASAGSTVVLMSNVTISGTSGADKLIIDKAITLDLNGKVLTTESGWGGIDVKNGASIKNGTIRHTGNTAAIKAFQVESIEDVTIIVTETENKVKGGIVVQEGPGCYIGSLKNVTIVGATNGIETYLCGNRNEEHPYAIGSMENVVIDATDAGMILSAPVGTATNCTIEGKNIGINMHLKGAYDVSIELVGCTVKGATGIYAHDEPGKNNPGTFTLIYDSETTIDGDIVKEFDESSKVIIEKK